MRAGHALRLGALGLTFSACESDVADAPMKTPPMEDAGSTGAQDTDGAEPPAPGQATDRCALAPAVGEGTHYGSLRGAFSELAGACGRDGPDTFFRVVTPYDTDVFVQAFGVGFTPRVGVIADCSNRWADRTLGCTEGVGEWILGVAAGTRLVVSVGSDPGDPQLQLPAPGEGDDPLGFSLDVDFRRVLAAGDRCAPATRGRCAPGLVCQDPTAGEGEAPAICTVVDADTCAQARTLMLALGTTSVQIPRGVLHTDAHAHSCGGGHRPDRVYALSLGPGDGAREITVDTRSAALGLAIRAPSCLGTDERDCLAPGSASRTVSAVASPRAGVAGFLFVELPPRDDEGSGETGTAPPDVPGEEAPFVLDISVVDVAPR